MKKNHLPVADTADALHVSRSDNRDRLRAFEVEVQFQRVGPLERPPDVTACEGIRDRDDVHVGFVVLGLQHTDVMHHRIGAFQLVYDRLVIEEHVL